jgi:hypothetical protein
MGIITNNLRPSQARKQTRLKMYNTFALPTLLHRCETWAIRDNISRNEIYEENAKYTRQGSLSGLKIHPVVNKSQNYRNIWIQHVRLMNIDRLSHLIIQYQPCGKRSQR